MPKRPQAAQNDSRMVPVLTFEGAGDCFCGTSAPSRSSLGSIRIILGSLLAPKGSQNYACRPAGCYCKAYENCIFLCFCFCSERSRLTLSRLETHAQSCIVLHSAAIALRSTPEPCTRGSGVGVTQGGGGSPPPPVPREGYREGYRYRKEIPVK